MRAQVWHELGALCGRGEDGALCGRGEDDALCGHDEDDGHGGHGGSSRRFLLGYNLR